VTESFNGHNKYNPPRDFRAALDMILTTPLTPENYAGYADNALEKLIDLDIEIRDAYKNESGAVFANGRELEDAAFKHFSLPDIDRFILPHIIGQSELINQISDQVRNAQEHPADTVFLPPDGRDIAITPGDGSFEKSGAPAPRTEMLMFILANEFNVNITDPEQFRITTGVVPEGSMREASYNMIETNFLDGNKESQSRLIFVNDMPGNATFVINGNIARELVSETFVEDLSKLTKTELRDLLSERPALGRAAKYERNWVRYLPEILRNPEGEINENGPDQDPNYLVPKLGKGETAASAEFAKSLGTSVTAINRFIAETNFPSLGLRKSYSCVVKAYDAAKLEKGLRKKGILVDKAKPNEYSAKGLGEVHGLDPATIKTIIADFAIKSVGKRRFGSNKTLAYDDEKFAEVFRKSKYYNAEEIKEGEMSISAMEEDTGISRFIIKKVVEAHGLTAVVRKNKNVFVEAFNREEIYKLLKEDGYIKPPFTRSMNEFISLVEGKRSSVSDTLKQSNLLNDLPKYKFSGRSHLTPGLDIDTQLNCLEFLHNYIRRDPKGKGRHYIDDETYTRVREQLFREIAELEAIEAAKNQMAQ